MYIPVAIAFVSTALYSRTLFASIFDPDLQVPSDYVTAEPSLRKKCKKIKGTAGPKRHRLIQAANAEKKKSESKIKFMDMRGKQGYPKWSCHHPMTTLRYVLLSSAL